MGMFARALTKAFDQGVGTIASGAHILQLGAGRSATGLSITTDRAMRYSAFWGAVRIISEDIAKLPLAIHEQLPDGTTRPAPEHPVERAIRYVANPSQDAFTFKQTGMTHVLTWGNMYALKRRDGLGYVRELWPLATDRMTPEQKGLDLVYHYQRSDGTVVDLDRADVFHVPGLSWDGVSGYSVIRMARETLGLGLAAEEHGARFFGNGASASFVLTSPNKLSPTALTNIRKQLRSERTGVSNAWKPWVLEEGLEPKVLSVPNDDAQWLETRKHQVTEIARWFRLPPHKLADLDRSTNNNIEHQGLEYVTDTLLGWLTRLEMAIGLQLLGDDWVGLGGRYYAKFNVNALLRGDFKTRMEGYATGMQWSFMTPAQIAKLEDWPEPEGGAAPLRPLTHVPVSDRDIHGMTYAEKITAAAALVRVGFDPEAAMTALGLPAVAHTGLVPTTVTLDPTLAPPSTANPVPVGGG